MLTTRLIRLQSKYKDWKDRLGSTGEGIMEGGMEDTGNGRYTNLIGKSNI
jgi:hypothetical protein